jgi:C1A family cysteine protease
MWTLDGAPTSYDLRSISGKLPPVRDQGSSGSCWAFATYGSLESCLRPTDTSDFSENNLKNRHGFDIGPNEGGNAQMSIAYLARWEGPVSESDDPYNPSSTSSPAYPPVKHVQEVYFLPANDPDTLKSALMTYGAAYANYYHNDAYYRSATYSYYCPSATSTNHAVAVVGWDDNFPASNFSTTPPGNGAWIVRNSWGTSWGQSGYFYISYYDAKFTKSTVALFHNAEPTTNYNNIYSYDPLGWITNIGTGSNTLWAANVFTVSSNEQLKAIGLYTTYPDASYNAYIYRNPTSDPVTGGTLVASKSGSYTYPGYHTAVLSSPVNLSAGDKFSVVVQMTTPGYNYPQAVECAVSGYSSAATASSGQSYYSNTGTTWTDLTAWNSTANFCIKGYTASTGSLKVTIQPAGAVSAGAQWRVDGGAWQDSEATVSFLSVGNHTVSFKTVDGWNAPSDTTVTISANTQTNLTGTYVSAVTVTSIDPNVGENDETALPVTIRGSGFLSGATVKLSKAGFGDITADNVVVVSSTQITCTLNLSRQPAGLRDVVVTNSDTGSGTLTDGFTVQQDLSAPYAQSWASLMTHGNGVGVMALTVLDGYVESRGAGLTTLQVVCSEPLDPATVVPGAVSVTGVNAGDCSSQVASTTLDATHTILTITFSPALASPDTYLIQLLPTITDPAGNALTGQVHHKLMVLTGGINGDRFVDVGDLLRLRSSSVWAQPVTTATAMADLNVDGRIDVGDLLRLRSASVWGKQAPAFPADWP